MILTFTPNPCVDKTLFYDTVTLGEKLRTARYTYIPGGKGTNVSRAVQALGRETAAMLVLAGHTGRHVMEMVEQDDAVRCVPFWTSGMTRTITTVLEAARHRQTAFFEPGPLLDEGEWDDLIARFGDTVEGAQVVTFNGAVSHPSLEDLYQELIPIAHAAGAKTILDSYGEEFRRGLLAKPYMVKPNKEEAAHYLGHALDSDERVIQGLELFHGQGVRLVVISLGAEGVAVSRDGERYRVRPPQIQEVNSVGSGDCLVAAFAVGLLEDWPLEKMARWGAAAGTANAMTWDIGHFSPLEVERLVEHVEVTSL